MRIFNDIKDALMAKKIPYNKFDQIIEDALNEHKKISQQIWDFDLNKIENYKLVKKWDAENKIDFIAYCIQRAHEYAQGSQHFDTNSIHYQRHIIRARYMDKLFKNKLPLSDEGFSKIIKATYEDENFEQYTLWSIPISSLLTQIKRQYKDLVLSPLMIETLNKLKGYIEKHDTYRGKSAEKLIDRIEDIIFKADGTNKGIRPSLFKGDDEFTPYANAMIEALPNEQKTIWYQLIEKAKKVSGGKPTKKYLTETKTLIKELGADKFKKMVNDWLAFLKKLKNTEEAHTQTYRDGTTYDYVTRTYIASTNNDTMKGLVWMCSHFHDATTLNNIAALCERCFQKIPGVGPAAGALGNACLFTLYRSKGLYGIGHLSRLKLKIKQNNTQKLINKYLTQAAAEKNVSIHEIEDMAVEDFGLENGEKTISFDDYTCQLKITGVGKSTLQWYKPDGNTQKSVPSFVKTKYADKLKKIKATKKQLEKTVSAQRDRIDRMFRANRIWNVEDFKKYYLEHHLMSFLAKKIIWTFTENGKSQSAILHNNQWLNADNQIVKWSDNAMVSLWHPATHKVEDIQKWRAFLIQHEIQQALKQAFREVYLLTDAEVNTGTYSNRMAAHVLKQHQFNTLAKIRGWSYSLMGAYDDGRDNETAKVELPEYKLRAEYWINEINADGEWNDTGIWNYIATDQVRFINTENNEIIELTDVPDIPFSEVLRDVDLFVGVASVGNDPLWQDSGNLPVHRDYWHAYSFGDLSEIAKNRKEILEGLVPRLKIKDVAEIKDKFLVVKGKLRTYKIHIGSGNILMEPNDQYLCIVPDRSKKDVTQNLFIPFEGDKTLSVILSKAFLLANDDAITDSTITSQIKRK